MLGYGRAYGGGRHGAAGGLSDAAQGAAAVAVTNDKCCGKDVHLSRRGPSPSVCPHVQARLDQTSLRDLCGVADFPASRLAQRCTGQVRIPGGARDNSKSSAMVETLLIMSDGLTVDRSIFNV